jgi:hypothetical protein
MTDIVSKSDEKNSGDITSEKRQSEGLELFTKLLGLTDGDVLRAVISAYKPPQPGALVGSWKQRKNYSAPLTSGEVWAMYVKHDFRCAQCGSQYKISLDHIDNNSMSDDKDNFQVLCMKCNRRKRSGNIKNTDVAIKTMRAFFRLCEENNTLPSQRETLDRAKEDSPGLRDDCEAIYLYKFLAHRFNQTTSKST